MELEKEEVTFKIIACKTLKDEIDAFRPEHIEVEYIESGYHRYPDQLRKLLQSHIDNITDADVLILGYGLCSNGLSELNSKDKTLIIPRFHDCIGILMGSREKYNEEFNKEPGTYYLSKGWIDELREPYSEYQDYVKKYGEEIAKWSIDMQYKNYTRLVFINSKNLGDQSEYKEYAKKVADFLGLKFEILNEENNLFEKFVSKDWENDPNFILVPPGEVVKINNFFKEEDKC